MKKIIFLIPVLALLLFSCSFLDNIVGSGNLVEAELAYTGFNALNVGSAFDVTLIHDDTYSVTVMVDDNVLDKVEAYRSGQVLTLGLNDAYRYTDVSLRAVITMPTLTGVELSDASNVTVISSSSFPSVSTFRASLSDASRLLLPSVVADAVTVTLSHASTANIGAIASAATVTARHASSVQMSGSSYDLILNVSDASVATLKDLVVADLATVTLSDASEGWVHVTGTIRIDVTDASSLYYRGSPAIASITLDGASSIASF